MGAVSHSNLPLFKLVEHHSRICEANKLELFGGILVFHCLDAV
jgi:hypothetical protein